MSWKKVRLPDVMFFQEGPGVRNTQFRASGIKLLNVGNINDSRINLNATKIYISEEEAYGKYKHFLVDEGDLVIASSGIVVDNFHNKIAFVEKDHLPLCMNTSTVRFKCLDKNETNINFFAYYLQTKHFKDQLRKLVTGSAQLNFGPSHLKQISFEIPPLPTQKHIASILDKADALRKQNRQLLEHYDVLLQSTFIEMFGDPVENPKGWEVKRLGEIAEVVSGVAKNSSITGDLIEAPYMRVANVQDGNLDLTEIKTISVFKRDFDKYQLKKNDILMTEGGDPDKLGRAAIWNEEVENCIHQNHIFRVRPDFSIINSWFLCNQFGSSYGKRYFFKAAKQTTGIASINMTQLKNFPALLPPVSVQRKFGEISQEIESQKQQAQAALTESEALFQGLLAGYFGEN